MNKDRKPMLASPVTQEQVLNNLDYPTLMQPKLDGIRAWLEDGAFTSRNGKPLRNRALQGAVSVLHRQNFPTLDGEMMPRLDPYGHRAFARATELAMSANGSLEGLAYHVFDIVDPAQPTGQRLDRLKTLVVTLQMAIPTLKFVLVKAEVALESADVLAYEALQVAAGAEGIMLRDARSFYKFGRSTVREAALLKLKRFTDDEATVVGFDEEMENTNPKEQKVTGGSKRSTDAEGLRGKNTLGSLRCKNDKLWPSVVFGVGSGFTAAERADMWASKEKLIGKVLKFKHQSSGADVAPRFPVFLGWRDKGDM